MYSSLDLERKGEIIANNIALGVAIKKLSMFTGTPVEEIAEALSEYANDIVDRMSEEEQSKYIEAQDAMREGIREGSDGANVNTFLQR